MKKILLLLILAGIGVLIFLLLSKPDVHKDDQNSPSPAVPSQPHQQTISKKKKPAPTSTDQAVAKKKSPKKTEKVRPGIIQKDRERTGQTEAEVQAQQKKSSAEKTPKSYSVEEAGRYFLPPEERKPGHLGGPPPMPAPQLPTTSPSIK